MIPIEIVLVILGIVVVVLSYFITEKISDNKTTLGNVNSKKHSDFHFSTENSEMIRKKINEILLETKEDIIETTEDQLSKISNEKIMAMSDFSDQILEKIDQNHQEVIFLYNMLNEKDNEIKDLLKQIENMKSVIQDKYLSNSNHEPQDECKIKSNMTEKDEIDTILYENNIENSTTDTNIIGQDSDERFVNEEEAISQNNNDAILAYHRQGMSIMDIAKNLCLGQGEVKLVIDLFQGERK